MQFFFFFFFVNWASISNFKKDLCILSWFGLIKIKVQALYRRILKLVNRIISKVYAGLFKRIIIMITRPRGWDGWGVTFILPTNSLHKSWELKILFAVW